MDPFGDFPEEFYEDPEDMGSVSGSLPEKKKRKQSIFYNQTFRSIILFLALGSMLFLNICAVYFQARGR